MIYQEKPKNGYTLASTNNLKTKENRNGQKLIKHDEILTKTNKQERQQLQQSI